MKFTEKSETQIFNEIKNWVVSQFPQDGTWYKEYQNLPLGSEQMFYENIPYHATDIEWLKSYIVKNYKCAYNYNMLRQKIMENFLESDDFIIIVTNYQNKIIDLQLKEIYKKEESSLSKKSVSGALANSDNIVAKVFDILTKELKMQGDIVLNRLNQIKLEEVRKRKILIDSKQKNYTNTTKIEYDIINLNKINNR